MVMNIISVAIAVLALIVAGYQTTTAAAQPMPKSSEMPRSFREGEIIPLNVNKMTSTKTLFPLDYYFLRYCQPERGIRPIKRDSENLGEFLSGDRIENSPYILQMKQEMYCEQLCFDHLGRGEMKELSSNKVVKAIHKNYHNNWILDNLPAASRIETDDRITTRYWQGFPIGFVGDDGKAYIHNHVNIEIMYHEVETRPNHYRVVRFMVQPFSIRHEFEPVGYDEPESPDGMGRDNILPQKAKILNPIASCNPGGVRRHTDYDMVVGGGHQPQLASGSVLFTYDVTWIENKELQWASRWDVYLTMDDAIPDRIHWLSIANSCVVILGLLVFIAVIYLRNLRHDELDEFDPLSSDEEEARAQELEEKGWKLIYLEAFDPPSLPLFFSVCCGTGVQLLCTALVIIFFASLGYMSAAQRGSLIQNTLFTFAAMGLVNGYITARFYKTFGGDEQGSPTVMAALLFPGGTFIAFLVKDVVCWIHRSTSAVPFTTLIILVVLWLGCSAPLVVLGAYLGNRQEAIRLPKQPRSVLIGIVTRRYLRKMSHRSLFCLVLVGLLFNVFTIVLLLLLAARHYLIKRNHWSPKWSSSFMLLMGGLLSFGALFVEFFYILSAMWLDYYYSMFGFLILVFLLVLVTSAQVAVIFGYIQLSIDGYFSWWWQFGYAGALSICALVYAVIYYQAQLDCNILASFLLYFGFMTWACLGLLLMMGFVGVVVSIWFVRMICLHARTGSRQYDQVGEYTAVELSPDGDDVDDAGEQPMMQADDESKGSTLSSTSHNNNMQDAHQQEV